jgi:hypothetical protein
VVDRGQQRAGGEFRRDVHALAAGAGGGGLRQALPGGNRGLGQFAHGGGGSRNTAVSPVARITRRVPSALRC